MGHHCLFAGNARCHDLYAGRGMLGFVGVLIIPLIPWLISIALGLLIGKFF